ARPAPSPAPRPPGPRSRPPGPVVSPPRTSPSPPCLRCLPGMVSAHDPGNGPGASGPGIVEPSRIRPRQTVGTAADLHRSPPVTPDTPGKPGRSAYQGIQSDISTRSHLLKRCTRQGGLRGEVPDPY